LAAPEPKRIEPGDRAALARELQRELKRVGCYSGEITGAWTTSSRLAMKTFVEHVNAALPIDNPDPVLLSLVQSHRDRACQPDAALASAPKPETAVKPDADKTAAAATAAGTAAATLALGASTAVAKPEANAQPPDTARAAARDASRPVPASQSGPVPPDGIKPPEAIKEKGPRRAAQAPRPPKVVRDFMRALGIKSY
jgi:hypothetical protein